MALLGPLFALYNATNRPSPMPGTSPAIGQTDPFNFVMPFGTQSAPAWPQQPSGPVQLPPPTSVGPPPGAMPVSLPMNSPAGPASPTPSAPAQPSRTSFGEGLSNMLSDNPATLMALGGGIAQHGVGGFSQAAPVFAAERQFKQTQQNQMLAAHAIQQSLISRGLKPAEAAGIALTSVLNPKAGEAILPSMFGAKSASTLKLPGGLEISQGPNGQLLLPGGGEMSLDQLVHYGQAIQQGNERAQTLGKEQGTAAAALPNTEANVESMLGQISELQAHPGKSFATMAGVRNLPDKGVSALNNDAADFINRLHQLKSGAFMQGIQQLKGIGRITQAEAMRAENTLGRMERTGDVDTALNDLRGILAKAYRTQQQKAGVAPTGLGSINTPYGVVRQVQ